MHTDAFLEKKNQIKMFKIDLPITMLQLFPFRLLRTETILITDFSK